MSRNLLHLAFSGLLMLTVPWSCEQGSYSDSYTPPETFPDDSPAVDLFDIQFDAPYELE